MGKKIGIHIANQGKNQQHDPKIAMLFGIVIFVAFDILYWPTSEGVYRVLLSGRLCEVRGRQWLVMLLWKALDHLTPVRNPINRGWMISYTVVRL